MLDQSNNPFVPGDGAIPVVLAGRSPSINAADVTLNKLCNGRPAPRHAFEGLRGVGKTALLAAVRAEAKKRGLITIHIEGDPGDTAAHLAVRKIAQVIIENLTAKERTFHNLKNLRAVRLGIDGFGLEFDHTSNESGNDVPLLEELLHDAAEIAKAQKTGLFVTVDEAHEADDTVLSPVLRAMHAITQEQLPATAWIAGLPGTLQRLINKGQTYAERIETTELGSLSQDETRQALEGPCTERDVTVDDEVCTHVWNDTAGYPFAIQAWGDALWKVATHRDHIATEDVQKAHPYVEDRMGKLMASRWNRATQAGQNVMAAMASLGNNGPWKVAKIAEKMGRSTTSLSKIRGQLLDDGFILAPRRGELAFPLPRQAEWIRRTQLP